MMLILPIKGSLIKIQHENFFLTNRDGVNVIDAIKSNRNVIDWNVIVIDANVIVIDWKVIDFFLLLFLLLSITLRKSLSVTNSYQYFNICSLKMDFFEYMIIFYIISLCLFHLRLCSIKFSHEILGKIFIILFN